MLNTDTHTLIRQLRDDVNSRLDQRLEGPPREPIPIDDASIEQISTRLTSDVSEHIVDSQRTIHNRIVHLQESQDNILSSLDDKLRIHREALMPHLQQMQASIASLTRVQGSSWEGPSISALGGCSSCLLQPSNKWTPAPCQHSRFPPDVGTTTVWRLSTFKKTLGVVSFSYSTAVKHSKKETRSRFTWFKLIYTLPSWLFDITVSVFGSRNLYGDPEFALRISRHFPKNDGEPTNIFGCIQRHDVEAAKILFSSRKASVFDTFGDRCDSTLMTAITYEDIEMTRLLICEGANPLAPEFISKPDAYPRIHYYWSFLYHQVGYSVPLSAFFQEIDLSELHEIVIGIRPIDLKESLLESRYLAHVGTRDSRGCTPLHYAASMNKSEYIDILISYGADIEARTALWQSTPLYEACLTGSTAAAVVLLKAGAIVDAKNQTGIPPLRVACDYGTPDLVHALLDYGADMTGMKYNKAKCVLDAVVYNDNRPNLDVLLPRCNADIINDTDADGNTVIFKAIQSNAPGCLQALLDRGADFLTVNKIGWTILHQLAAMGSPQVMSVFASRYSTIPCQIDPIKKDNAGKTALDLLLDRVLLTDDIRIAFHKAIRAISLNSSSPEGEESDDEFFDAQTGIECA